MNGKRDRYELCALANADYEEQKRIDPSHTVTIRSTEIFWGLNRMELKRWRENHKIRIKLHKNIIIDNSCKIANEDYEKQQLSNSPQTIRQIEIKHNLKPKKLTMWRKNNISKKKKGIYNRYESY